MRKSFSFFSVFAASIILASCAAAPGTTNNNGGSSSSAALLAPGVYVTTTGNDSAIGTNASAPMLTIQLAISNAVTNGLTNIYVAEGTYSNGAGLISTNLTGISNSGIWITNAGIHLSGGWNSSFTSQTGKSLLNGNQQVKHVITVGYVSYAVNYAVIDGFCVIGGTADIAPAVGGGIYARLANYLTITNTIISNNRADSWGGGVTLENCDYAILSAEITSNYCGSTGGGVFLYNCVASLIDANISKNRTLSEGGGIYINGGCSAITQTGQVVSNTAVGNSGGGISCDGNNNYLRPDVLWNRCWTDGGGIYLSGYQNTVGGLVAFNNTISGSGLGGGVALYGPSNTISAEVRNNSSWYAAGYDIQSAYNTISGTIINNCSDQGGSALYFQNSAHFNSVINAVITNNYNTNWNGVIGIYDATNLMISNCLIDCGKTSDTAIYEYAYNSNSIYVDNLFITNRMTYLYYDTTDMDITVANWTRINDTNYTDALKASGNKVTNM